MKTSAFALAALALSLTACSSITPRGAAAPEEFDYALTCKLKQDDPKKCEAQVRALCADPAKAVVKRTRHIDSLDDKAVLFVYQASCNS